MAFLKKVGRIGGAANRDFTNVLGIDEGPSGKAAGRGGSMTKSKEAFRCCTDTGVVDDMAEDFPFTSSGTRWSGFTDQVMGGVSMGTLAREDDFCGRTANVMRGHVSLANNGGFIQMATDLNIDPQATSVDASSFDGVELDVTCTSEDGAPSERFNVQYVFHIRKSILRVVYVICDLFVICPVADFIFLVACVLFCLL